MTMRWHNQEPWITALECEKYLGIKANTVRNWHDRGRIGAVGRSREGRWLFLVGDVLRLAGRVAMDDLPRAV